MCRERDEGGETEIGVASDRCRERDRCREPERDRCREPERDRCRKGKE